jgi:hypothetical protein
MLFTTYFVVRSDVMNIKLAIESKVQGLKPYLERWIVKGDTNL